MADCQVDRGPSMLSACVSHGTDIPACTQRKKLTKDGACDLDFFLFVHTACQAVKA